MTSTTHRLQHLNPPSLLRCDGLSQIVCAQGGRLAFIAGQSAYDRDFTLVGGDDFRLQAAQCLRHLLAAIEAAGGSATDLVASTVYVRDLSPKRAAEFAAVLAQALDGAPFPPHAFSLIGVAALAGPGQLVEISGTAVLPG